MVIICRRYRTSLSAYLESEADTDLSRSLKKHLAGCPECTAFLETFRKTIALCRNLPLLPFPEELHSKIMQKLETELKPHPPTLHLIVKKQVIRKNRKEVGKMADRERRWMTPFEPFRDMTPFRDEFDRFFRGLPARWTETVWVPALDITEEEDRVVVKATLPGIDKNNLEVKVNGDVLVLTGRTEEKKEEKEKNYYIREINTGSFRREVALPAEVDSAKVTASYRDGILTINLPKVKEAKAKEVKIKIE